MSENNLVIILSTVIGIMIVLLILSFFRGGEKKSLANKSRRVKKPPIEFSKMILYSMFSLTLIIVACAIVMSYVTQSTDVYGYLIPSIFAELSVGTLFYYRKAEKENLLRESNRHELEMSELKSVDNNEEDII